MKLCLLFVVCLVTLCGAEDWELGPFVKQDEVNPILEAINSTTFLCPLRGELVNWEAKDVFNPTALVRDGQIHLLYRGEDYEGMFAGIFCRSLFQQFSINEA